MLTDDDAEAFWSIPVMLILETRRFCPAPFHRFYAGGFQLQENKITKQLLYKRTFLYTFTVMAQEV